MTVTIVLSLHNSSNAAMAPFTEHMVGVRNCTKHFLVIHSFNEYLLSPYNVPGTFVSVGNKAMNKRVKMPALKGLMV